MISIIHRSLICVLVLLQLVTPLVHAHSGQEDPRNGFHLPGLELLTVNGGGIDLSSMSFRSHLDGTIVSVSSGIQQKDLSNNRFKQPFILEVDFLKHFVWQKEAVIFPDIITSLIHFYSHTFFPRAPPVTIV